MTITKDGLVSMMREMGADGPLTDEAVEAVQEAFQEFPPVVHMGSLFPAGAFSMGFELGLAYAERLAECGTTP